MPFFIASIGIISLEGTHFGCKSARGSPQISNCASATFDTGAAQYSLRLYLQFRGAQTNIIADGFRSLAEGEQVEYIVETSDDGRAKAVEVSGPNGAPVQVHLHPLLISAHSCFYRRYNASCSFEQVLSLISIATISVVYDIRQFLQPLHRGQDYCGVDRFLPSCLRLCHVCVIHVIIARAFLSPLHFQIISVLKACGS